METVSSAIVIPDSKMSDVSLPKYLLITDHELAAQSIIRIFRAVDSSANTRSTFKAKYFNPPVALTVFVVEKKLFQIDYKSQIETCFQKDVAFREPVGKICVQKETKNALEKLAKENDRLLLCLSQKEDSEDLAVDIEDVCKLSNPKIEILKIKISTFCKEDVLKSFQNTACTNRKVAKAIDARNQIQLRISTAFSLYQTTELQANKIIPFRLDFILALRAISQLTPATASFVAEFKIKIEDGSEIEFQTKEYVEEDLSSLSKIVKNAKKEEQCIIERISRQKVEMKKPGTLTINQLLTFGSRCLKISPHDILEISKKMYLKGLLSDPETTDPNTLNFEELVKIQVLLNVLVL